MTHTPKLILLVLFLSLAFFSCKKENADGALNQEIFASLSETRTTLPNGWSLTPAGNSLPAGDLPLNLLLSHDEKLLAATNNGQSTQSIMLYDVNTRQLVYTEEVARAWVGLAFSQDDKNLFVSGANDNRVWIYAIQDQQLSLQDSIVFGQKWPEESISVAGIAVDAAANILYAVSKEDSSLYLADIPSRKVTKKLKLPAEPYTCLLSSDENELYVSLWGGKSVAVFDTKQSTISKFISVGSHPNDMCLSSEGKYLYVACANDNSVSIIDTESQSVIEVLSTSLYPDAPAGSTSNGVALSANDSFLYIANADNNCLVVFDVHEPKESKVAGYIPTGWYPTAVEIVGSNIWVANGKGMSSLANPKGPNPGVPRTEDTQYIGGMFIGTVSVIPQPDEATSKSYEALVLENTPYMPEPREVDLEEGHPIPTVIGEESPIKHVFYVVKENRTYDQVFGDIPEGNGEPSLCLFPDSITPNQHALAKEFVLLDNFYVNAEVSADGHNWTMGGYANDYTEKTWPTLYSSRGGTYDYEGTRLIAYPDDGFIWDLCKEAGVSYRSYGIFGSYEETSVETLEEHMAPRYPGYDLSVKDTLRINRWKQEFDSLVAISAVPQFNMVRLGNDHTAGARVNYPTPAAMVADNDLAVGMLVNHISNSPIWKESAIFILEDDAQNGPDHVDAHRSIMMIASPYTRRNTKVSELYSTCSVLRTMELILGLPPMSQYDAAATPMYACFQAEADLTSFELRPAQVDLNEMNKEVNELSMLSASWDMSREDAAPDLPFNQVIWRTVRGIDTEMPAPRRSAFLKVFDEEEEEEGE